MLCDFERLKWRTYLRWTSFIWGYVGTTVSPLYSNVNVVPIYAILTEIEFKTLLPQNVNLSHISGGGHWPECFLHVTASKCWPINLSHIQEGRHFDQNLSHTCDLYLHWTWMYEYINCIHTPQIFHFYWNYVFCVEILKLFRILKIVPHPHQILPIFLASGG